MNAAGWYLVSVYADDPITEFDEGATPGDTIAFTVNGHPAVPSGPDAPVWTEMGDRVSVELEACSLAGDFDCDYQVTVADLMRQSRSFGISRGETGYYPPYDRDGDEDIDSTDLQRTGGEWRDACQEP